MKVLFLDVDGVLNDHARHPVLNYCTIDKDKAERLNRVLHETGAVFVLTSAWRYLLHGGSMTLEGLRNLFLSHWVDGSRLHDITGKDVMLERRLMDGSAISHPKPEQRGDQIEHWLRVHGLPDRWVVVDDEPNCFTQHNRAMLPIHFTDGRVGLTDADAGTLVEMLGKRPGEGGGDD